MAMVGYVYYKPNFIILEKIIDVQSIQGSVMYDYKGDSATSINVGQFDYIILEEDTINLNLGDTIDLTGLVDLREVFLNPMPNLIGERILEDLSLQSQINTINNNISDYASYKAKIDYMYNYLTQNNMPPMS